MARTNLVKAARKFAGKCEKCFRDIDKGAPYKWIGVKAPGSHPGQKRIRCAECDDWHVWEYNPSLAAQCQRVAHDTEFHLRYAKEIWTEADAKRTMADAAAEIDIFANTRQVSADRARYVFGEKNFRTRQFMGDAEALRRWAQQMRRWNPPPLPEPELTECELCKMKGMEVEFGGDPSCMECQGEGKYIPEEPSREQVEEWRHEVADDANGVLENCPI